jgi:hypothetical protein
MRSLDLTRIPVFGKAHIVFIFLMLLLCPLVSQAVVTGLTAVALDPNPASPTTPVTLVVTYCAHSWNQSQFLVEVNNLGWTTIPQWHIPIVGQYFLVDKNGTTQSDYVADDFNNGGGPAGWNMNDAGRDWIEVVISRAQ